MKLMELADDNKTAGTLMFSWLLYEDFIVLNSSPVLLCVSVTLNAQEVQSQPSHMQREDEVTLEPTTK